MKTITQDIALGRTLADIDPEGWPFSDVVAWNDPQKRTMENLFRIVNLGDVLNVVRKRLKSLSRDGYDGLGGMKL